MERRLGDLSTLEGLKVLRDHCSEEIPSQRIDSLFPDEKSKIQRGHKVRRNWWTGLVGCLENALNEGLIKDASDQEQVRTFLEHYTSKEFYSQALTTAEDIERANRLISMVLGEEP